MLTTKDRMYFSEYNGKYTILYTVDDIGEVVMVYTYKQFSSVESVEKAMNKMITAIDNGYELNYDYWEM